MIWILVAALAVLTLAPLAWVVTRQSGVRGRRDAAMALHRAQLGELDRDLAAGRLLAEEHTAARLEVQRRLLSDAALTEEAPPPPGRITLLVTAVAVPVLAMALYLQGGHPFYQAERQAAAAAEGAQADKQAAALIAELRTRLTAMDPASDRAREGYIILGRTELSLGHLPEAAEAWRHALAARFDPMLAASTAELMTETDGHVSEEASALFRRALAEAPANAPWRHAVEARLNPPARGPLAKPQD